MLNRTHWFQGRPWPLPQDCSQRLSVLNLVEAAALMCPSAPPAAADAFLEWPKEVAGFGDRDDEFDAPRCVDRRECGACRGRALLAAERACER
ncbi:hypothetical protein MES4922_110324 [Mesorhizobium ventifaucium]|uniref:Uncharacterized protein n=1 Tax=Mesorhizobium ventifaucium TaxID=666020 RepID=A0ABM9DGH5_9HYPH|nr:hypothetical protein MES4922_110324 [Mesorhizobium ventifaucium]